ncbi:MAG TPA: 16S rRNA (cytosine(1402)-N(4))-methyltransferase RsmH, partial [Chitinophagales bacterium]|nr:16S rRNA (cytosine(1402)-N(4))-methyltransferase RsmH [Chitinophagales bacterium]
MKTKPHKQESLSGKKGLVEAGGYHTSVLLHECVEGLAIKPGGLYVDVTFGGGGHSKAILKRLGKKGKLIAFDQDEDALKNAPDDKRLTLIQANFRDMKRFLRLHEAMPVDGILADLGVSSWQFDTADRGFSYRFEGPLDMRMNKSAATTAANVLNGYDAERLQNMLGQYGEVRNAKTLAQAIVEARNTRPFETIADLKAVAEQQAKGELMKYLSQVFQAIRIEVNDELGALKEFLIQSAEVLKPGGRLAVISFHSLEDRLVKNYMKHGAFEDEPVKDFFGRYELKFKPVTKKPVTAGEEELKNNPRSRSAKLRIAER